MTSRAASSTDWYRAWAQELAANGPGMSDRQSLAAARLATVLLCGEQSAIHIFSSEIRRNRERGMHRAIRELALIEHDEHLHEQALKAFCNYLPVPEDRHSLKRRAQRYFAELGREIEISRHFARISRLDSAVCRIMWHVENSGLERLSPLRLLAKHIKIDEARHVAVSRRYAAALPGGGSAAGDDAGHLGEGLVQMLQPLASSFEDVGVDSDRLFTQLRGQ